MFRGTPVSFGVRTELNKARIDEETDSFVSHGSMEPGRTRRFPKNKDERRSTNFSKFVFQSQLLGAEERREPRPRMAHGHSAVLTDSSLL